MILGVAFQNLGLAKLVARHAFDLGLVIETCGADDQVLKLLPPLTITQEELASGLDIIAEAVARARRCEPRSVNGAHARASSRPEVIS